MGEKRFTLRMSDVIFEFAKNSAEMNNRSIAKEIELALFRYYVFLPTINQLIEDYKFNINDVNSSEKLKEYRNGILKELEDIKSSYTQFEIYKKK